MEAIYEYHLRQFKKNKEARRDLRGQNWRHISESRVVDALRITIAIEVIGFTLAAIAALYDSGMMAFLGQ